MMAVRCPACNERVEGRSSADLSRSIRSHFNEIHKTDIDVEMNISDEGCGYGAEEVARRPETGAQDRAASARGRGESTSGSAGETRDLTEFECPVCREDIKGGSEEEMSEAFREHLSTTHKDEPFVTQVMEKFRGRR